MKYDMFISYRRTDRELVAQVVRKLEANGVGVWYDAEIEGGADWRETIVEALTGSDMLVIFFSEECNASRQLKKELAIADDLGKAVVPILIEDTKPKGAYLYELADRNWIQAFPDPVSKIDTIVRHLTLLAEKSDGGLEGEVPVASRAEAPRPAPAPPSVDASSADAFAAPEAIEPAAMAEPAAPGWRDPPKVQPQPAPPRQRESGKAAPKLSDYMPKLNARQKKAAESRDILPFKWIDCLYFLPFLLTLLWWAVDGGLWDPGYATDEDNIGLALLVIALVAFYGALVFPIRYYLRKRPPGRAFKSYVTSSAILYAVFVGAFLIAKSMGVFPNDDAVEIIVAFGFIWICFAILAFVIYGVMSAQRAISAFQKNVVKI